MAEATKQAPGQHAATPFRGQRFLVARRWGIRLAFYALLITAWQVLFNSNLWQDFVLPGPLEVLNSLATGWQSGSFLQSILASLARLATGYTISLVLGLLLGLLIGRSDLLKETLGSLFLGLQALPSICWLPLAILWFGLNDQAIVFVVVMGALFAITLGVESGVRNTSPIHLKAARNLGTRGRALYLQVLLPAAFPAILIGLKQGWSFAWRSLMAGELLYNTVGLGNLLETGRDFLDSARVVGVMLLIIVIGVAIDALIFRPLEKQTRARWGLVG
ncbi:MAG TPA: ABC transporter permease [Ktedonobacteraceae bacterium]|jgi:NitT/TauT family transport system permease protein